jgi:hypothetical protein
MSLSGPFPARTDRERAVDYLNRPRPLRPKAPPQTEALFAEPERQERRLLPIAGPTELFPEPEPTDRNLVPVDGWPDPQDFGLAQAVTPTPPRVTA